MPTVASTAVTGIPPGYNNDNRESFQATVGAALASDTVTVQLPSRWTGRGVAIEGVTIEQFAAADAGARTRTSVPIVSWSHVESTGVLSVLLGATAITNPARIVVTVLPGT